MTLIIAIPLFLRWAARSEWTQRGASEPQVNHPRAWRWVTIATLTALLWVCTDLSPQRRSVRLAALKQSLNPAITLTSTGWEQWRLAPIPATLDVEQLVPRSTPWDRPPLPAPQPPSVIIVAVESFRHDVVHLSHQNREITPNINRLAARGRQWTHAYSQSTHSDYADVCIVSSLYPLRTRTHHYYGRNDPWPKTLAYDLLQPAGYSTAIISSQNEAWGGMDAFLESPHLDLFYHPQRSAATNLQIRPERDPGFAHELKVGGLIVGKFPDAHTADKAIDWIREQAKVDRPFFLSINFQSSHFPFLMPEAVPRPFQPCKLEPDVHFMRYPRERTPQVRNAYYNALHESDRQVGRIVSLLRELSLLDNVLLFVIGENGEAFHENGYVGHAREPVEPAIHVATILHAPRYVQPAVDNYPLEHVDLMPTLFGLLGWPAHPNFQGIDVLSPNRPPPEQRLLFFHVLSPAARADAVQWAGRWKYMVDYQRGRAFLYDLREDPGETRNQIDTDPQLAQQLHEVLMEWRQRQLAYYHYPRYYGGYYPPRPPRSLAAAEGRETAERPQPAEGWFSPVAAGQ